MQLATQIDGPLAVIGDLHGQTEKLVTLLNRLRQRPDYQDRWIVFMGDLVDRGPDSSGTVQLILDLIQEHPKTTIVSGNHDLAMGASLKLVPTPEYSDWAGRWLDHYSSQETFASYNAEYGNLEHLRSQLPEAHAQLLGNLPWVVEHPTFLFVHAGLDPLQPYSVQIGILRQRDYSLNRPLWLCEKSIVDKDPPQDCPKVVVSGHVKYPKVEFRKRRILCDTTGGQEGELSCVLLPEARVMTSGSAKKRAVQPAAAPVMQERRPWWKFW